MLATLLHHGLAEPVAALLIVEIGGVSNHQVLPLGLGYYYYF